MRLLEIIHLRSPTDSMEDLASTIERATENHPPGVSIEVYRRQGLATDLSVHIVREEAKESEEGSTLGLHLASELRAFGMVRYTLWIRL